MTKKGAKTTAQQLQTAQRRNQQAERLAGLGFWEWDRIEGRLTYCSEGCAHILEQTVEEFLADHRDYEKAADNVHPADRQRYREVEEKALETGVGGEIEYRIITHNGRVRHLREISEHMKDDTGKVVRSFGILQDITEHKELEDQLRQSQKMEAVGQLTGGVAHDFNNLLAVILGNCELLEDRIGDDEEGRRQLEEIKRSVGRASSLTHRLLAFSRQQALSPVATNLNDMVAGLEELLHRTLGETIDLRVETTTDLWLATLDRHQFENVMVNLAINARDAMPAGGELTIETANTILDATDASQYEDVTPGDYVMVAVSDAGTGMPPEVLDKVFEPFFTTKGVGEGSGLGLSMVYGFVKQSGGHVKIYSEEGHGTTVKLYMPRSGDTAVEEDANEEVPEIERGAERILVVEDNESVLEISANIFRDWGYEVVEARNGDEAVDRLRDDQPFDLLFTDVVLPGARSGVDIAQEAKRLQPHIKVLYTTGYTDNAAMQKVKLDRGVVINKPYRRAELLEQVRNMLDSKNN